MATIFFSLSFLGIDNRSKRTLDREEEYEIQVNQSFDQMDVVPEAPLFSQDGELFVSGGYDLLNRPVSPQFTTIHEMIECFSLKKRTVVPEYQNYSLNNNIRISFDLLSTWTSIPVFANTQARQDVAM